MTQQIQDRAAALVAAVQVGTMSRDSISAFVRTAETILFGPDADVIDQAYKDKYESYKTALTVLATMPPAIIPPRPALTIDEPKREKRGPGRKRKAPAAAPPAIAVQTSAPLPLFDLSTQE